MTTNANLTWNTIETRTGNIWTAKIEGLEYEIRTEGTGFRVEMTIKPANGAQWVTKHSNKMRSLSAAKRWAENQI